MNQSPGSVAFSRDVMLDIPLHADVLAIQENRQCLVGKRLLRENAKRIAHDYVVGDLVWKKRYLGLSDKLQETVDGPHPIKRVWTNGTVSIRLSPNLVECINIRRIRPRFLRQPEQLPHGEGE